MLKVFLRTALLLAAILFAAPPLVAQQPPGQDGFVPVGQAETKEELPAAPLVAAAYGVAWAAILFYVWSVWRRLNQVDRELADVARRIEPGARR